jgi:hypothetical protein
MVFSVYSPALGQESSSPDVNAKSMLQACETYPNYGTQLDFEDVASGTTVNTQYSGLGVLFGDAAGGPTTIARTDGARPLDGNILVGLPIFTGDIYASFWIDGDAAYVTDVGASVGYLDATGSVTLYAYDCDGNLVDSYTNTTSGGNGIEFMHVHAEKIHEVRFIVSGDPAGSDIDCFTYGSLTNCTVIHPIPTLTEWGLIIFCVLLFGWMTYTIIRRRQAASVRF